MIIRAIFFDLDGTLVDSLADLTDAVNHVRSVFLLQPLIEDSVRLKVGKGVRNLLGQVLPDVSAADIELALGIFTEFNREHIADKSRLYPGIFETLAVLASSNFRLTVISNKQEELSRLVLQTLGVDDLFEIISGGDTHPEGKPSPLPLLNTAAKLGVAPSECLMVGDSINDIEAGQRANITTIGCTWGYGGIEELAGADFLADSPQELLARLIPVCNQDDTYS
jgi:phosphoglycolate phosphatase